MGLTLQLEEKNTELHKHQEAAQAELMKSVSKATYQLKKHREEIKRAKGEMAQLEEKNKGLQKSAEESNRINNKLTLQLEEKNTELHKQEEAAQAELVKSISKVTDEAKNQMTTLSATLAKLSLENEELKTHNEQLGDLRLQHRKKNELATD